MKITAVFLTILALGAGTGYAQDEGFYTRGGKMKLIFIPETCYIECWRASNQSPNPVLDTTLLYPGRGYLHWWVEGEPPIEYGWDYSFIAWKLENNDSLFSDYTDWQLYDKEHRGPWTYDLVLQYSTTRPTMPPRGQ